MDSENSKPENLSPVVPGRPFLLTWLSIFTITSYLVLALLFLISLFYSGRITSVINLYVPEKPVSGSMLMLIFSGGAVLHLAGLAGIFLMLRMKKSGYYLFSLATLLICSYQLLQQSISPVNTTFYIILIILFGFFIKKLR
ncbi:MAG: hypothetical protein ACM3N9_08175 [Syntrophothermus sp.]